MRNSVIATIGSLMFLLGGCVSYQPKPLDPRAELAALDARTLPAGTLVQLRPAAAGPPDAPMFDASDGLSEAERLTRAGELGEAVWAYLSVLEVDPDYTTARRQVGKVATAVRQFDQTAPGRRWLRTLQKENRWQRWATSWQEGDGSGVWGWAGLFLLYFGSVIGAYYLGMHSGKGQGSERAVPEAAARVQKQE